MFYIVFDKSKLPCVTGLEKSDSACMVEILRQYDRHLSDELCVCGLRNKEAQIIIEEKHQLCWLMSFFWTCVNTEPIELFITQSSVELVIDALSWGVENCGLLAPMSGEFFKVFIPLSKYSEKEG